jgi:hypothetical protein
MIAGGYSTLDSDTRCFRRLSISNAALQAVGSSTSANKAVLLSPHLMRSPDVRCQHSKHAPADVALSASSISSKHPELPEHCTWPRAHLGQLPVRAIASTTGSTAADGARITLMIVARPLRYVSGEVHRRLRVKVGLLSRAPEKPHRYSPICSTILPRVCRLATRASASRA